MKAIIIPPEGAIYERDLSSLADFKNEIGGGYLEFVRSHVAGLAMYIDEGGKMKGMPVNDRASRLANLRIDDVIVGPAVLFGTHPMDGEEHDCPFSIAQIQTALDVIG